MKKLQKQHLFELEILCIIINLFNLICPSWINVSILNFWTVEYVHLFNYMSEKAPIYIPTHVHPTLKAHKSNYYKIWFGLSSAVSECEFQWNEKVQSTALLPSLLLLNLLKMMLALGFSVEQHEQNISIRKHEKVKCGVRDKWDQLFIWKMIKDILKHKIPMRTAPLEGPREVVHGWLPLPVWFICFLWRERQQKGIPKTSCVLRSGQVSEVTVSRSALASACGSKINLQFQHVCLKPYLNRGQK